MSDAAPHATNAKMAAAATALQDQIKYARLCCSLRQIAQQKAASAKHAPAFIEQMTGIQLIEMWQLPVNIIYFGFLGAKFQKK